MDEEGRAERMPRQPIPSIEESCHRFMHLATLRAQVTQKEHKQRSIIDDTKPSTAVAEGVCKDGALEDFGEQLLAISSSPVALEVQKWLLKDIDAKDGYNNPYTTSFFREMHLRNRDPLPFGENYSVALSPLSAVSSPSSSSSFSEISSIIVAALQFWQTLYLCTMHEECETLESFLRDIESGGGIAQHKGIQLPKLESKQYHSIFAAARLPGYTRDTVRYGRYSPLKIKKRKRKGKDITLSTTTPYFIVAYRGIFYRIHIGDAMLSEEKDDRKRVRRVKELSAVLVDIVNEGNRRATEEKSEGEEYVGLLTCMGRDEATDAREKIKEVRNKNNLQQMQEGLFMVCLDGDSEGGGCGNIEFEKERQLFNFLPLWETRYCNRWFEQSFQIITSMDRVGLNFEHSVIDSNACHKFCSFLYRRSKELLLLSSSDGGIEVMNEGEGVSSFSWEAIKWTMEPTLCSAIEASKRTVWDMSSSLLKCCLDGIIEQASRSTFKQLKCSPDGCFQIALQLAVSNLRKERAYCLETIDVRHFEDGRLMIADTFTAELKELWDYLDEVKESWVKANHNVEQRDAVKKMGQLFQTALVALGKVIARHKTHGEETYLHLPYLLNESDVAEGKGLNPLSKHPIYENVYNHYIVGSNLGADEGIRFVYSGIPPLQSQMNVIGYMLLDDRIAFTFTSREAIDKDKLIHCLKEAIGLVVSLAEASLIPDGEEEERQLTDKIAKHLLGT